LFVLTGSNPDFHTNLLEGLNIGGLEHTQKSGVWNKKFRILDLEAAVLGSFALCFFFFSDIIIVNKYIIK